MTKRTGSIEFEYEGTGDEEKVVAIRFFLGDNPVIQITDDMFEYNGHKVKHPAEMAKKFMKWFEKADPEPVSYNLGDWNEFRPTENLSTPPRQYTVVNRSGQPENIELNAAGIRMMEQMTALNTNPIYYHTPGGGFSSSF